MPAAEAPKQSTCEAIVRNPMMAQMFQRNLAALGGSGMGALYAMPQMYLPTRMPRNPDYRAPPKVPVGSPLPELGATRFGVEETPNILTSTNPGALSNLELDRATGAAAGDVEADPTGLLAAAQACRALFRRGGNAGVAPGEGPVDSLTAGDPFRAAARNFENITARVVREDKTLPMAFALFEQGRYGESLTWFHKAYDKLSDVDGGDEAALFIGKLNLAGFGEKDPREALKWLERAASANFSAIRDMPVFDPAQPQRNTAIGEAAMILAGIHRVGIPGVPKDMATAIKWYRRAEFVGHVAAATMLGDIYYRGLGVPRDAKEAVRYYRRAARLDMTQAQVALAGILEFGAEGVKPDMRTAIGWYQAAARHGDRDAMFALGLAYDSGNGVPKNAEFAFSFFRSAAMKGLPAAKVAVGSYFQDGIVVKADPAIARQWYEAAARDGDPDGMFSLATSLANGAGGTRDPVLAWQWMKRAAAAGQQDAAAALAGLEAAMTPAERASATTALATVAQPPDGAAK
ncbi:tetratricopeptide/SEL1-like repeat protein [Roseomonas aeriglobus]|nr:tetratricopeptide/SEL1-like repeat protein [Roseomonas aeriglobus]